HISYEAHAAGAPEVDALVELLGQCHGAAGREAEAPRRLLLQSRGGERRCGTTVDVAAAHRLYGVGGGLEQAGDTDGVFAGVHLEVALAALAAQPGAELRRGRYFGLMQQRVQGPVFLGGESEDLALAVDDHTKRRGLYAAGREASADLAPEHGADLVADQ